MWIVDVVIVSYNSRGRLRGTVEPLATSDDVHVIVVDNASAVGSLASIADLRALQQSENRGFAYGYDLSIGPVAARRPCQSVLPGRPRS